MDEEEREQLTKFIKQSFQYDEYEDEYDDTWDNNRTKGVNEGLVESSNDEDDEPDNQNKGNLNDFNINS